MAFFVRGVWLKINGSNKSHEGFFPEKNLGCVFSMCRLEVPKSILQTCEKQQKVKNQLKQGHVNFKHNLFVLVGCRIHPRNQVTSNPP